MVILYLIGRGSPEQQALDERAITEVETRISPTEAFNAISLRSSATFYNQSCMGMEDWPKQTGVIEFIDVTRPTPGRAELDFCVNTETWEIRFDNDLAKTSLIDNTKYLAAKYHCFGLTDAKNIAREKVISAKFGDVFLKVNPSGEDTSKDDFSCTSIIQANNSQPAVWKLWPNASKIPALIPDTPFTPLAKQIEQEMVQTMRNRCQDILTKFGQNKAPYILAIYGENTEPVIFPRGVDSDDPKLTCQIVYSFGDFTAKAERYATWYMIANAEHPEMQAQDDDAKAVDQFQSSHNLNK
jgi:hypothetical protein